MDHPKKMLKQLIGRQALRVYHAARSRATSILFRHPAQDMVVIGVTGTNGKTTTAHLIAAIFEQAGHKVAMLSTVRFRIIEHEWTNATKMTVPDPWTFNRFASDARKAGCAILVMEATSIALDQSRMNVQFDTGVLTNITHDHLDYHGTFDHYVQAKRNLFARGLRLSVVNVDDPQGRAFATLPANTHIEYSIDSNHTGALRAEHIKTDHGIAFDCVLPSSKDSIHLHSSLIGMFNVSNILAAVGVALGHGIGHDDIRAGIAKLDHVPGRMEFVDRGQAFKVVIDYAHTPDALQQFFASVRPMTPGHIIAVFGSCGDRDQDKRPIMGAIAASHAAYCVVTNEDPYTEDPGVIIDAVAAGIHHGNVSHKEGTTYWRIPDRREAIRHAFRVAKAGDTVTITGKGAEEAMVWGRQHRPWSDLRVVAEELEALTKRP